VRRYVQNHAIREAYSKRDMTHDGWAEIWFDDLDSMAKANALPEWKELHEDGMTLFASPISGIVARERVQKEIGSEPRRWGASEMSEESIRDKLRSQGYAKLAEDPKAAAQIKDADANGALAVWTWEHIVTIDDSRIDARPSK
jgi:hypothetical protein